MGDGKREGRRFRTVESQAPVTPEMLWPLPEEARGMDQPSARAGRTSHPSVRARRVNHLIALAGSVEPKVILGDDRELVDLSDCGNRCGKGVWCEACRAEIRAEALRWLRELNVVRPSGPRANLLWSRAWNREILLADQ